MDFELNDDERLLRKLLNIFASDMLGDPASCGSFRPNTRP